MSENVGQLFKDWMVASGKSKNTASNYFSGVNTVSDHSRRDLLAIDDPDELERLYRLYGPNGEHAGIGGSNSRNVHSGLKQWLAYNRYRTSEPSIDPQEGRQQWDKFLERWPVSKLRELTLEQYYGTEGDDTFYSWMRDHTNKLGDFKEGLMSAGVRLRGANPKSEHGSDMQSDSQYLWYRILGDSAQQALDNLKAELLTAIDAVQQGDLGLMSGLKNAPGSLVWKVAFLYQNRSQPLVLPFFNQKQLKRILGAGATGGVRELQQQLMARRGEKDVLEFAAELEREALKGQNKQVEQRYSSMKKAATALNQILFGPPGTGKTYATVEAALEVLDSDFLQAHRENRSALKRRFDEFAQQDRIRFVTFHQSFSYEDFVEGLRADTSAGQISYAVQDGIFKELCNKSNAVVEGEEFFSFLEDFKSDLKDSSGIALDDLGVGAKLYVEGDSDLIVSFGSSFRRIYDSDLYRFYCGGSVRDRDVTRQFIDSAQHVIIDYLIARKGAALVLDAPDKILLEPLSSVRLFVRAEIYTGKCYLDRADLRRWLNENGYHVSEVIARLESHGLLKSKDERIVMGRGTDIKSTQTRCWTIDISSGSFVSALMGDSDDSSLSYSQCVDSVFKLMKERMGSEFYDSEQKKLQRKSFVLIIDEINRGNISRIFGELITLIEPSKRAGADEALSVVLPYSKQPFSVPSNLYLIGTMNTADRSLAGLDIALRRRFVFREMPPQPELLNDVEVEGLDIGQLLRVMNQRIEVLLDRDHCLGHAYFMPLKGDASLARLAVIFRNQILPLLQEYFFEDWERISWVLNDQQAESKGTEPFIQRPHSEQSLAALFGSQVAEKLSDQRWEINGKAFDSLDSYLNILG